MKTTAKPSKRNRFEIMVRGVGPVMTVWGFRGHREACEFAASILGLDGLRGEVDLLKAELRGTVKERDAWRALAHAQQVEAEECSCRSPLSASWCRVCAATQGARDRLRALNLDPDAP